MKYLIVSATDPASICYSERELIIATRRSVARGVDLVEVWTNFEIGLQLSRQRLDNCRIMPTWQVLCRFRLKQKLIEWTKECDA